MFFSILGETVQFPLSQSFVNGLQMDDNGNLSCLILMSDDVHEISLNYTHRPMHDGGDRIQILKTKQKTSNRSW